MDYSFVEAGGKVPGDTQSVPFDFRSRDEVFVMVDGVDVSSSFYSWISDGLISIGAGFPSGTKTRVERRTSIAGYESSQSGSSVYDWRGANANFNQNLFIIQEYADKEGARNAIVDGLVDNIEQVNELVDEASGYRDLCAAWAMTPEDVDVPGQATGSRSSLHYSVKSYKFSLTAGDRAADSLTYANQSKGYRDTTQGYAQTAQAYAVSMSLINGTDYSAKYWANQAYLAGGVPIGTIIDSYGNGTTTPVGYLKVIPGLEITNAYPEFRQWAINNGWAVNGSGNPVFPSTDDALFKRQWRAGQTLRDVGRAFGTIQADRVGPHTHNVGGTGSLGQPTTGAYTTGGGGTAINGAQGAALLTTGTGIGPETNPANITVTWFIKAYSAPLDAATVAAAQVLADLADVRARVSAKLAARYGAVAVNPNTAAVLFTGIPAEVNRVTIKWSDMNVSASALPVVRVGSGSIQVGTYVTSGTGTSSTGIGNAGESSGIALGHAATSGTFGGLLSIERLTAGSNIWVYRGQSYYGGAASGAHFLCAGKVTLLAGELDRVQMTTLAGTATISGTIAVTWEF